MPCIAPAVSRGWLRASAADARYEGRPPLVAAATPATVGAATTATTAAAARVATGRTAAASAAPGSATARSALVWPAATSAAARSSSATTRAAAIRPVHATSAALAAATRWAQLDAVPHAAFQLPLAVQELPQERVFEALLTQLTLLIGAHPNQDDPDLAYHAGTQ